MKSSNKITIVLPNLNAGGAEHVNLLLAEGLLKQGYAIDLVLFNREGKFMSRIPEGVKLIAHKNKCSKLAGLFYGFFNVMRSARSSSVIIAGLELSPTYVCYAVKLLVGKPVVAWLHVDLVEYFSRLRRLHHILIKFIYPKVDMIVSVSQGVRSSLLKKVAVREDRIKVIYNISEIYSDSIINADNEQNTELQCLKRQFSEKKFILSVGRLTEQKGFDFLIKTFYEITNSNKNIHLVILGDGPLKKDLLELTSKYGISDKVHLIGFVSDVGWFYRHCWILVHPARFEGLGMVLIEAMSCGKPVISTDCPSGPREVLSGGKYGVLSPTGDVSSLLNNILMMEDKSVYEKFSKLAALRAKDFSCLTIIPEWKKIIDYLVDKH